MKFNKFNSKGFILPIILVYLFISHIVYIHLLRYQQSYLEKQQNFQKYCQSQIQIEIVKKFIFQNNNEVIQTFTEEIKENIVRLKSSSYNSYLDQFTLYEDDQIKFIQIIEDGQDFYQLETFEIYLNENIFSKFVDDKVLQIAGYFDSEKNLVSIDDSSIGYSKLNILQEDSMVVIDEISTRNSFEYRYPIEQMYFEFNTGYIEITPKQSQIYFYSHLFNDYFSTKEIIENQIYYYDIIHNIYTLEITDS